MLKLKVIKRKIKQEYKYVLAVGYCELQNLLSHKAAFAYSCDVNGWACDYYYIANDFCIATGYSPIGKNCSLDYDRIKHYDKLAMECPFNDYDGRKNYRLELLNQLMNEVKGVQNEN